MLNGGKIGDDQIIIFKYKFCIKVFKCQIVGEEFVA